MIIAHSSHFKPKVLKRTGATTFTLTDFAFRESTNQDQVYQPYFKFADDDVTLDINTTTAGTGVTCTYKCRLF